MRPLTGQAQAQTRRLKIVVPLLLTAALIRISSVSLPSESSRNLPHSCVNYAEQGPGYKTTSLCSWFAVEAYCPQQQHPHQTCSLWLQRRQYCKLQLLHGRSICFWVLYSQLWFELVQFHSRDAVLSDKHSIPAVRLHKLGLFVSAKREAYAQCVVLYQLNIYSTSSSSNR